MKRTNVRDIKMNDTVAITIEGQPVTVEDREYTGAELRGLAGLAEADKLVRENDDGTETAVPAAKAVRPHPGENYFRSVRHRRG